MTTAEIHTVLYSHLQGICMKPLNFGDKLEVLGILLGAFVVITALGTLAGLPWSTAEGTLPALVQVIGIVGTIGVGVFLILVSRGEDIGDRLPI